jgi:tRNA(Ser,Leu) C12 N-acetylase TAN1
VQDEPRQSEGGDKRWNLVATIHQGEFRCACRLLAEYGDVRRTSFYNVVVATVDEPREVVHALALQAEESPAVLASIARLFPADVVFDFSAVEEFERKTREAVLRWLPALAGKSFHVRLHRRGFKGRLSTPHEERLLDELLLAALAEAGTPGRISFDDPDAVIDVETVGRQGGISLWTREELRACPLVVLD